MLYIHGRMFMIGPVFPYQRLSKDFIFLIIYQNLGVDFRAPKSSYRSPKCPVLPPVGVDPKIVAKVCFYY